MRLSLKILSEIKGHHPPNSPFMGARGSLGFSLVELMVVISIIGVLSAMTIPNFMKATRRQMAISQMRALSKGIQAIRASEDLVTKDITGNGCSACSCWFGNEKTAGCRNVMDISLKKLNFRAAIQDPWGGYYMLDENENEFAPSPGRVDVLLAYNADDNTFLVLNIPNYTNAAPVCGGWWCGSKVFE